MKLKQASNRCKRVVEFAKLAYTNKTRGFITSQKLVSCDILGKASVLNKGISAIPPLFNDPEVLFSGSEKAKWIAENVCKNSNHDNSLISFTAFPSRTNLKLYYNDVTPKMLRKVISNLDSSKASGPDYISVVVLKKCDPELSYILTELFNKCLKESCFPDSYNISLVEHVFKGTLTQI